MFFEMAGRKKLRSSSDDSLTKSKHKMGYSASWKMDFPWHTPVYTYDTENSTSAVSLLCSLCQQTR